MDLNVPSACDYTMNECENANLVQPNPAIIIWFCAFVVLVGV